MRLLFRVLAGAALIFAIGATTQVAVARADEQCEFTLSAPELTQTSYGVEVVTATLTPGSCPRGVTIIRVTVCVAASGTSGRCQTEPAPELSRVLLEHAPQGVVYVATGKGCSYAGDPVVSSCAEFGPLETRL